MAIHLQTWGGSRISGIGVVVGGGGVHFADFIAFYKKISHEIEIIFLTETKLFHFRRIFKRGGGGGGGWEGIQENPL